MLRARPDALARTYASHARGFTLVELMAVVAILGILSAVAIGSFTRQLRASYRTQVVGDLSTLSLRQKTLFAVRGHYATATVNEADSQGFPVKTSDLKAKGGAPIAWNISDSGYTLKDAPDKDYTAGGPDEHGFDVLNFVPQNGTSRCSYGSVAGDGSRGANKVVPPNSDVAKTVFPAALQRYYASDWFYSFAHCDFDGDGDLWTFTTSHVSPRVYSDESSWGE